MKGSLPWRRTGSGKPGLAQVDGGLIFRRPASNLLLNGVAQIDQHLAKTLKPWRVSLAWLFKRIGWTKVI
jgi:hypothetical protein